LGATLEPTGSTAIWGFRAEYGPQGGRATLFPKIWVLPSGRELVAIDE